MALSRFYKPTNYEYMSQFVPKNLEIMDRGLQRAQAKQDKQVGKLDELSGMILKQNALEGYDTEVRDQVVGEVKSFSEQMANTDLTSPENFRKVNQFVQSMANDERIQKLNMGLASKAKYDKIKEDLLTKGDYATENDRIFAQSYDAYLKQPTEDSKFAIDYIGGKELIEKNAPARPELEKLVDNMKADSITKDRVTGEWINRSTDKVLSYDELMGVLGSNINSFYQTKEGRQMARRAEMNGVSFQDQFLSEIEPVAQERAYEERSRTTRSNAAHLLNKKKLENETAVALVQKGKTPALFGTFKNIDDYNSEIETLKTSDNPMDNYKAAQMEAQKELLNENFSKNLTNNQKFVLTTSVEDLKDKPEIIKEIGKKLYNSPLINYNDKFVQEEIIQKAKYKPDLVGEILGDLVGVDYKELKEKRDSYIAKGEIFEANDIILTASKGSSDARKRIAEQAKTAFNDINLNVLRTTKEDISVDETINTMDQQSIKITDGLNGPEISYRYKDDEGKYQYITVASKDLGQGLQETTNELYQNLSGGDPIIYTQLVNSHRYSNLKPISKNSNFNQKDLILQHLPQEEATILNRASDVKIIQNNNGTVSIVARGKDKSGIEKDLYNVTAPTVPQAMKLLEIQL